MPPITDSSDALDRRLNRARDLLDTRQHRARNGVVSLMALVAAGVSATLLFTLVFGTEEAPAQARTKTEATPAAFELSASALSASATESTTPPKPAQPMLVATEK